MCVCVTRMCDMHVGERAAAWRAWSMVGWCLFGLLVRLWKTEKQAATGNAHFLGGPKYKILGVQVWQLFFFGGGRGSKY